MAEDKTNFLAPLQATILPTSERAERRRRNDERRKQHNWKVEAASARSHISFSEIAYAITRSGAAADFLDACRLVIAAFEAHRFIDDGVSVVRLIFDGDDDVVEPAVLGPVKASVGDQVMWGDVDRTRKDLLDHLYMPRAIAEAWFSERGWIWSNELINLYGAAPGADHLPIGQPVLSNHTAYLSSTQPSIRGNSEVVEGCAGVSGDKAALIDAWWAARREAFSDKPPPSKRADWEAFNTNSPKR